MLDIQYSYCILRNQLTVSKKERCALCIACCYASHTSHCIFSSFRLWLYSHFYVSLRLHLFSLHLITRMENIYLVRAYFCPFQTVDHSCLRYYCFYFHLDLSILLRVFTIITSQCQLLTTASPYLNNTVCN